MRDVTERRRAEPMAQIRGGDVMSGVNVMQGYGGDWEPTTAGRRVRPGEEDCCTLLLQRQVCPDNTRQRAAVRRVSACVRACVRVCLLGRAVDGWNTE